jgi:excisionase family DNA binding protein
MNNASTHTAAGSSAVAEVYTVKQVVGMLGLSARTTYELVRAGEIPAKRVGGRLVIPRALFHAWLNHPSSTSELAEHHDEAEPSPASSWT